jgi:hypothetical protein
MFSQSFRRWDLRQEGATGSSWSKCGKSKEQRSRSGNEPESGHPVSDKPVGL